MLTVGATCLVLLMATTVLHYEALRGLTLALPHLGIAPRARLIAVIVVAFAAHFVEIFLYALAVLGASGALTWPRIHLYRPGLSCGRLARRGLPARANNATAQKAAPATNVAAGPKPSQSTPASTLATNSASPLARLNRP